MDDKITNVLFAGIGGQGIIKASDMLTEAAFRMGYDVKKSELHGMSQRGGSVVTYVRFGEKVYSPIITEGEADYLLSFEKLEAARWAQYLKIGGEIIVNTQEIDPMPVIIGSATYPTEILNELKSKGVKIDETDALSVAESAGSAKAVNIVLLSRLAKKFPIPYEKWIAAIEKTVAPKFVEMNKKAFELGYNL